jgi:energy-coupling factor transporter ATP-binding protein EcfA2
MNENVRITSIRFRNYKAFEDYSVSLTQFNVLVGPNNAGKSTVLGAIRLLAEGVRRARTKTPDLVGGPRGLQVKAYPIALQGLPVSTENIFHNYNESEPATAEFRLSNGGVLSLYFREQGECYLIADGPWPVRGPSEFRRHFSVDIAFVPTLGPVEHNERLYQKEAARLALLSHGASRNFRNIWYHFPEGFEEFRHTIQQTWPGMDIQPPELTSGGDKPILHMFCPEDRFPREIFWAGFGFQVWCQMLTFILQGKGASLLVVDEPDIYLHSDLQRQLVNLLQELGPDIVLATHSAEIIAEVEPQALLNVNKQFRSARHVRDSRELQEVFQVLGSNLNPTLTQLAKTRRVVFVEGKEFQILARLARRLGLDAVANRSEFAVIAVNGFNPQKVKDFALGMEATLGAKLLKFAIFDRDYRCDGEVAKINSELMAFCWHVTIHDRKELENFLLEPVVVEKTIRRRLAELARRGPVPSFTEDVSVLLMRLSDGLKNQVQARLVAARQLFERAAQSGLHPVSISEEAMDEFDAKWGQVGTRMRLVPGKELLSALNAYLQNSLKIAVSASALADSFGRDEMPPPLLELLHKLDEMRSAEIPEQPSLPFEGSAI